MSGVLLLQTDLLNHVETYPAPHHLLKVCQMYCDYCDDKHLVHLHSEPHRSLVLDMLVASVCGAMPAMAVDDTSFLLAQKVI